MDDAKGADFYQRPFYTWLSIILKCLAASATAESNVNQLTQSGEYAKIRKTKFGVDQMEHRVAMISIIAQETEGVEQLNALLEREGEAYLV